MREERSGGPSTSTTVTWHESRFVNAPYNINDGLLASVNSIAEADAIVKANLTHHCRGLVDLYEILVK